MIIIYPQEVKIYIDGVDRTFWIFGTETINPSDDKNTWQNIDISNFVRAAGVHRVEAICASGIGRLEVIVEIS